MQQVRLPLGDAGDDWRQAVRLSLARHRERRARLGVPGPGGAPDAAKVVPFQRPSPVRRIPVAAAGSQSSAAGLACAPEPAPIATPSPEPLAEPVIVAPPRPASPSGMTLPLPFATAEGHVEIEAPPPPNDIAEPIASLAVRPASPQARFRGGIEDAAWAVLLAASFSLAAWIAHGFPAPMRLTRATLPWWLGLIVGLPAFWSLILAWTSMQLGAQTPGMRRAGLVVMTFDGRLADRALRRRRTWASVISLGALGLGYFWVFLDPDQMTWHDHLSGTLLVAPPRQHVAAGASAVGASAGSRLRTRQ